MVVLVAGEKASGTDTVDLPPAFHAFAAGAAVGVERTAERNCGSKDPEDQ